MKSHDHANSGDSLEILTCCSCKCCARKFDMLLFTHILLHNDCMFNMGAWGERKNHELKIPHVASGARVNGKDWITWRLQFLVCFGKIILIETG